MCLLFRVSLPLKKREREKKKRISSTLDSQQKGKCKYQLFEWEESKKSTLFKNDMLRHVSDINFNIA